MISLPLVRVDTLGHARYLGMHADYRGKGVDQLAEVIHTIKTDPESRRIVLTAWNPPDLPAMALPPCHMFAQFYVANGELSCQVSQPGALHGVLLWGMSVLLS